MAQAITLRHLLSHTSGLDDTDDVEIQPWRRLRSLPFAAFPGRAFRYSNIGFDIAVLIAAQAAGLSYQDFLRTRVLAPLAMEGTHWRSGFPLHSPFTTARDLMRLADEHPLRFGASGADVRQHHRPRPRLGGQGKGGRRTRRSAARAATSPPRST